LGTGFIIGAFVWHKELLWLLLWWWLLLVVGCWLLVVGCYLQGCADEPCWQSGYLLSTIPLYQIFAITTCAFGLNALVVWSIAVASKQYH
jgi:hypothetical protein